MKRVTMRIARSAVVVAMLAGPGVVALAPTAASAAPAATGNVCGLPTQAIPGSIYQWSYPASECHYCNPVADYRTTFIGNYWYCTYNPTFDHVDLQELIE